MIDSVNQTELADWIRERVGLHHTPDLVCIGRRENGRIVGVVGFESFNGAAVCMHVAGEGNWLSRSFLHAMFHYPFIVCKVNVVIAPVASTNARAIRLNERVGFKADNVIKDGHPDGDLMLMTMRVQDCKFIGEHHG